MYRDVMAQKAGMGFRGVRLAFAERETRTLAHHRDEHVWLGDINRDVSWRRISTGR